MIQTLRHKVNMYAAIAAMVPKTTLAYSLWVWTELIVQILSMTIFVYFWRAVYSNTAQIGGLDLQQTLNYILWAQILLPVIQNRMIFHFGFLVGQGMVSIELLRPMDFQMHYYVENLTSLVVNLTIKLPLVLFAVIVFGLRIPSSLEQWVVFLISLLFGQAILFFFDWIFACLAFYSTETWGLSVVREGVAAFFSGALVPLVMMPGWLQRIADILPFAQSLSVPVSFLSGITSLSQVKHIFLVQIAWLLGLIVISRLVFRIAVRKVTVQGG